MGQNKDLVCYRKSSQPGGVLDDSGSKSRVLNIKEMLRVFRSQKMSTASDQYFSSYVKKTSRNRVKVMDQLLYKNASYAHYVYRARA